MNMLAHSHKPATVPARQVRLRLKEMLRSSRPVASQMSQQRLSRTRQRATTAAAAAPALEVKESEAAVAGSAGEAEAGAAVSVAAALVQDIAGRESKAERSFMHRYNIGAVTLWRRNLRLAVFSHVLSAWRLGHHKLCHGVVTLAGGISGTCKLARLLLHTPSPALGAWLLDP